MRSDLFATRRCATRTRRSKISRATLNTPTACMINIDAHLNDFASRCFRDIADRDYISARMCYRAGLISQFHWSALQAFEKYFKAILLYNRIKAKNIGHDLGKAQAEAKKAPFEIRLSETSARLLDHLDSFGRFRYLETSYFIHGPKLVELDKAVWELRRYCRVLNYDLPLPSGKSKPALDLELKRNENAEDRPPQEFRIAGGALEAILARKTHPSRAPLIWQNGFFGSSRRKRVKNPRRFYAENSPLSLYPQLLDHVLVYIHILREVVAAYRVAANKLHASS